MINKIGNIHCMALNYKGVGSNTETPLYFVKSLNTLNGNNSKIAYPNDTKSLWTEVELAIIIKEECFNIPLEEVKNYILGITVACDLTRKNIHDRDHHLAYSKSLPGFCPIDMENILSIDNLDVDDINMSTEINGLITQSGNTKDMIYNIFETVAYLSKFTKLSKNDVILTGTPSGVENNIIKKGDKVVSRLENLTLKFEVI